MQGVWTTVKIAGKSADVYEPRAAVAARPVFSWTGFYIGGNGGWAWSND